MLQELSIRNFAIIDDLTIRFSSGLTILSGETGAGKSILINAVNLLLGSRAASALVRSGSEAAELEALFEVAPQSPTAETMAGHDFDPSEGLLIRRVISRTGSNRIYINGRLATMQTLNTVTENLASISGQHAHQGLLREEQHLLILDRFGGLMPMRLAVSAAYADLLPLLERLAELQHLKQRQSERLELLQFQCREIEAAAPQPDEDRELEQEQMRLRNSEMLYRTVYEGIETLYGDRGSVAERLEEVRKGLEKAGGVDAALKPHADKLGELNYRIEDQVAELRTYLKGVQMDEGRLEAVEERLDVLNRMKRKYGGTLAAALNRLATIRQELAEVENLDARIAATQKSLDGRHAALADAARRLSAARTGAAGELARKVELQLTALRMPNTRFEVALHTTPAEKGADPYLSADGKQLSAAGFERAVLLIAPNVGEELKPLASIASGGELSRVILALKAILAANDSVETVIFDEVDAGIGGGTAETVGRKLSDLSRRHQVICITHLPQIAKFGDHHYSISKTVAGGRTRTVLTPLDPAGRVEELARMLGGVNITPATLNHARELLRR